MSEGKECGMSRAQQHWQCSGLGSGGRFGCVYDIKNTPEGSGTCISWPTATHCVPSPLQMPSDVGTSRRERYLSQILHFIAVHCKYSLAQPNC